MGTDLSVVIPAYNEAKRLAPTVRHIVDYLRRDGRSFEVVVVDDGSADATAEVARSVDADEVLVLRHMVNRGKGAALRTGVLASQGRRVLILDADMSTPIDEMPRLEPHLEEAEVVFGSRAVEDSNVTVYQPFHRVMMGKVFNLVIRLAGVRGMRDTQCGFKLLDGEVARQLFAELTVDRFAYDVELVWLARHRGYRVAEQGVLWADSGETRVHPVFDSLSMLRDVIRFRFRHRRS